MAIKSIGVFHNMEKLSLLVFVLLDIYEIIDIYFANVTNIHCPFVSVFDIYSETCENITVFKQFTLRYISSTLEAGPIFSRCRTYMHVRPESKLMEWATLYDLMNNWFRPYFVYILNLRVIKSPPLLT